jgi:3'(2'), 5'-bisphosphate nucleotidase
VALGLVRDGTVALGVLGCPELYGGSIYAAARGEGTWSQPLDESQSWDRRSVSGCSNVTEARILRSVEKSHTNVDEIGQLAMKLGIKANSSGMDSQAKYAVLAGGEGEVMLRLLSPSRHDYRETIWDQAAGSIVVEEAGGRITDLDGKNLDFSQGRTLAKNRGIVATNGRLHDAVLKAL